MTEWERPARVLQLSAWWVGGRGQVYFKQAGQNFHKMFLCFCFVLGFLFFLFRILYKPFQILNKKKKVKDLKVKFQEKWTAIGTVAGRHWVPLNRCGDPHGRQTEERGLIIRDYHERKVPSTPTILHPVLQTSISCIWMRLYFMGSCVLCFKGPTRFTFFYFFSNHNLSNNITDGTTLKNFPLWCHEGQQQLFQVSCSSCKQRVKYAVFWKCMETLGLLVLRGWPTKNQGWK